MKCLNCDKEHSNIKFCSKSCNAAFYNSRRPKKEKVFKNKCSLCSEPTNNPNYCSRKCASKINNKTPKKKRKNKCVVCSTPILSSRKYCENCTPQHFKWLKLTLGDIKKYCKHTHETHAKVRGWGRRNYKNSLKPKKCCNCGYSKHFHICHIKPVSSFEDHNTMEEINNLNNLVALCPNCHWELDNGFLTL